jgi:hypothetical protein
MTTTAKIKLLEDILHARLPFIRRWGKVNVYQTGDTFIIRWDIPKSKGNPHPFETKEVPIKDIDDLIKRNAERLNNEVKTYK